MGSELSVQFHNQILVKMDPQLVSMQQNSKKPHQMQLPQSSNNYYPVVEELKQQDIVVV